MSEDKAEYEKIRLAQWYEDARGRIKTVSDLALLWLRSMVLLSGGAIVALFTLIGRTGGVELSPLALWWSFALFALALVLTMVALFVGWMGQDHYYDAEFRSAERQYHHLVGRPYAEEVQASWDKGSRTSIAAIIIAIAAMTSLAGGAATALFAVRIV